MLKHFFVLLIVMVILNSWLFPAELITTAESSGFKKTSTYNEVVEFVFEAQKKSDKIHVLRLTTSTEGRMIPLVVISHEGVKSPAELRMTNKPAVLIMANIHAGEVEGKEAAMMLIREIVTRQFEGILDHQVVLVIPIFNADGNEKFGKNRRDNGPELAGVRYNGQFLDLNRDYLKLESPEVNALVTLFNEWDPILFVDLHTTNGSYHREPVTYTTQVNPNSDPELSRYMWEKFFPAAAQTLKKKYKVDSVPYGNFVDRTKPEKGWRNHAFNARYGNNYGGLRNRFAILVENYSHADFKTRVMGCFGFIKSILLYSNLHAAEMQRMCRASDAKTQTGYCKEKFALEFKNEKLMELTIKSYQFKIEKIKPEERHKYPPWYGDAIAKKTDILKDYKVDYFCKAVPVKSIPLPGAYIILPFHDDIINKLKSHGITLEKIRKAVKLPVEHFVMKEIKPAKRLYQGHVFLSIKGHYEEKEVTVPENSYYVSMKQPLARLIPVLLEPESEDSLISWGFFNREIVSQWTGRPASYPVYRLNKPGVPVERCQE
jgi:hypothetical protein